MGKSRRVKLGEILRNRNPEEFLGEILGGVLEEFLRNSLKKTGTNTWENSCNSS